ncbi:hypothetical protein [Paenibacillus agricola]|uniref:BFN domain-containing protein n=1 Tax=Paenibacillus agricola TaxID=2716264 RepID=A0ABX0JIT1_9BACL|nr:hypothetical protein [Paenibacillus agricola]NHN35236.1 hypothetical protein [Paenibacillus agricola]
MQHIIKNQISVEQIDMLKSLRGTLLINMLVDDAGEFVLSVLIDSPVSKLIIRNIPTNESDGDEYPKLKIEQVSTAVSNYKEAYTGKSIKDIIILRDIATWQNNSDKWMVDCDIGLKIIFEDDELLLIAYDSLAGLLKLLNPKEEQPVSELLKEYWSMKTDRLASLKREEIYLKEI